MNYHRLIRSIKLHEGYRKEPYKDTKGLWTVGYGHLIHYSDFMGCDTIGELMTRLTSVNQHELWLETDIAEATSLAIEWTDFLWKDLGEVRQEIMVEMFFQMGTGARFPKMLESLSAGDYQQAAYEMLDSKWAKVDTPGRAAGLSVKMERGIV